MSQEHVHRTRSCATRVPVVVVDQREDHTVCRTFEAAFGGPRRSSQLFMEEAATGGAPICTSGLLAARNP